MCSKRNGTRTKIKQKKTKRNKNIYGSTIWIANWTEEIPVSHSCAPISIGCVHLHCWDILFRDGGSFCCCLGTVSPVSLGRNASEIMLCSHCVLSGPRVAPRETFVTGRKPRFVRSVSSPSSFFAPKLVHYRWKFRDSFLFFFFSFSIDVLQAPGNEIEKRREKN